jgi:2-oxoglutarate dehydrogenase E1 component
MCSASFLHINKHIYTHTYSCAQFGDFFNGAQIIVDQFLSAMEDKWLRQTGLVMLLPHGYEGMGPEHSSGRVERFLQMANQQLDRMPTDAEHVNMHQSCNWQVCNITTPANFFHVLRRQVRRQFRKPLIVMTPKSLLRHPAAKSDLSELAGDTVFQPMLSDPNDALVADNKVKRVIFCSGKVYYDIVAARADSQVDNIAVVRVEQVAPFPMRQVSAEIARYPNAEVVWAQEEPQNQGPWAFARQTLHTCMKDANTKAAKAAGFVPAYVGRTPTASTATGRPSVHAAEQKQLSHDAVSL